MNWQYHIISLFLPIRVGTLKKFKVTRLGRTDVEIEFHCDFPGVQKMLEGVITDVPYECSRHGEQPGTVHLDDHPKCLLCMKEDIIAAGGKWCV
ncbi:MAG: hypothetical protein EHJ94_04015 [Deltaproteobacteria bacterium]|nr:MAG: hypothetical protein EHJ94_04015 [Deltaproteobacteria bacterium]